MSVVHVYSRIQPGDAAAFARERKSQGRTSLLSLTHWPVTEEPGCWGVWGDSELSGTMTLGLS